VDEFSLINKYFDWDQGIGDDCALISIDHGKQLATTVDTSCGLTSAAMVYLIFSSSGASSLGASPLALGAVIVSFLLVMRLLMRLILII
jgi:hypothetical protein